MCLYGGEAERESVASADQLIHCTFKDDDCDALFMPWE